MSLCRVGMNTVSVVQINEHYLILLFNYSDSRKQIGMLLASVQYAIHPFTSVSTTNELEQLQQPHSDQLAG